MLRHVPKGLPAGVLRVVHEVPSQKSKAIFVIDMSAGDSMSSRPKIDVLQSKQGAQNLQLESAWCIYYDSYIGPGKTAKEYQDALVHVGDFSDIGGFWSYMNNLQTPSRLPFRASYHVMRKGIAPVWEDDANKYGGTLSVHIRKGDADFIFLDVLMAAVGEQFGQFMNYGDDICGLSISTRKKESVLNIWTRRADLMISAGFLLNRLASLCPGFAFKEFMYKVHQFNNDFERDSLNESVSVDVSMDTSFPFEAEYGEFIQNRGIDVTFLQSEVQLADQSFEVELGEQEFPAFPLSPIRRTVAL